MTRELAASWAAAEEGRLPARREHARLHAAGAGPDHGLPFTNRVIVTLVYLRFQLPHAALAELYRVHPQVRAQVDAGYRGLAKESPDQVQAPPLKPKMDAAPEETAAYEEQRHQQSSERICVEHANAEHKQ